MIVGALNPTVHAQKAELVIQTGHTDDMGVSSVAFSSNGKILVTTDTLSSKVWDVETAKELRSITGVKASARCFLSPAGNTYAVVERGQPVEIGSLLSGSEDLRALPLYSPNNTYDGLSFSPDGTVLASIQQAPAIISLVDVKTGQRIRTLAGHTGLLMSVAFSPDGNTLASLGVDGTKFWNWHDGTLIRTIKECDFGYIVFSPDGKLVANFNLIEVMLFDAITGRKLLTTYTRGRGDFSADGKILAVINLNWSGRALESSTISLLDTATGAQLRTVRVDGALLSLLFSPDGKTLAIAGMGLSPQLIDAATLRPIRSFRGYASEITSLGLSSDGSKLASGKKDGHVAIWDLQGGQEINTLTKHAAPVNAVAFSSDGNRIASSSTDNIIKLWDLQTRKELKSLSVADPATQRVVEASIPEFYKANEYGILTRDGKFKIYPGVSGAINLTEAKDDTLLAQLISLDENEWAVVTPGGLFDASPGARKLMRHVVGLEPVDLDQTKDVYYVPNLLQAVLRGDPLPNVELFSKQDLFPKVEYEPLKSNQTQVTIKLTNRGGGIGQVQVLLNGKEIVADARPPGFNPNLSNLVAKIDLSKAPVRAGEENRLEIVARNSSGSLSSRGTDEAAMVYKDSSNGSIDLPNIYAIVGGISDYAGEKLKLGFAANDAEEFAHALELGAVKLLNGNKNNVHIRLLTSSVDPAVKFTVPDSKSSTATKADFAKAFSDFRTASPSDVFIVYLAGHGVSLNLNQTGETYLYLTQEATTTNKSVLSVDISRKAMTISSDELKDMMKQNKALKQVLILDTCAAGAFSDSQIGKRELPTDQVLAIERLKDSMGFFVLMGAAADAPSYEASQYGQGLLTYSLLQGMKGARLRENQFADVAMLFGYAQDIVPQMAKNIRGIQQPFIITPYKSRSFDIGQFTLEEQKLISISTPKPLILLPRLRDSARRFDTLNLSEKMTQQLKEMSYSQTRGAQSPIVFVDANEMSDAIRPEGDYLIEGETLKISLVLVKNSVQQGKEIIVSGNVGQPEKVIKALVEAVVQSLQSPAGP
jgi:WD40 repeat protein